MIRYIGCVTDDNCDDYDGTTNCQGCNPNTQSDSSMNVQLSKSHGVNPSLEQCFICGQNVGVVLFGQLKNDEKAPYRTCSGEPCDACKEHMKQGIVLISVDESKSPDTNNPYRTGGWVVVTEDFIKRIVSDSKVLKSMLKRRMAFLPDEVWNMLGLPRGDESSIKTDIT